MSWKIVISYILCCIISVIYNKMEFIGIGFLIFTIGLELEVHLNKLSQKRGNTP